MCLVWSILLDFGDGRVLGTEGEREMRIGDATTYDFAFGSAFEPGGLFAALGQFALGHFGVFRHGGRFELCLELCVCVSDLLE